MISRNSSKLRPRPLVLALAAFLPAAILPPLIAQDSPLVTHTPPQKIAAARGATVEAGVSFQVRSGYHANSNRPNEDYLIPLRLRWEPGPLAPVEVIYPKAEEKNYGFSAKPVSVFTGEFRVVTRFKVDANAPAGPGVLIGKLRYQACSDDTCYRPATLEIRLPYEIH